MPSFRTNVLPREKGSTSEIPEWASEGVVLLERLSQQDFLDPLVERFRVQREGGYTGIDLFLFSFFHLTSRVEEAMKRFGERSRPHSEALAAVAGRKRLPSPSSMSRGLNAVCGESLSGLATWMLLEVPGTREILRHPSVQTRDVLGQYWQLFDLDETVTTLRQRALPERDDTPPARRRAADLAAPGYSGRKRGDVQVCRSTVQHAGSALWVESSLAPGNGDRRTSTASALEGVCTACELADAPPERAILRYDGAGGNVPFITECKAVQVHYVTRLSRYELLNQPDVAEQLDLAVWHRVPSESGPERQAVVLGTVTLKPSPRTLRQDGSCYDPVETCVIVSRYRDPNNHGAGRHIGGWRYELFGTDCPLDSWPAPELVALYYGRAAEENRFAQEDRELGLDRIFSYHLEGQAFVTLVGLFIWNLRICRGFEMMSPPAELPPQGPREVAVAAPPEVSLRAALGLFPRPPQPERRASPAETGLGLPRHEPSAHPSSDAQELRALCEQAAELVHTSGYVPLPGWRWDDQLASLVCPNETMLTPSSVERPADCTTAVRYRAPRSACRDCGRRSLCTNSTSAVFRRSVRIAVPDGPDLQALEASLAAAATARRRQAQRARAPVLPKDVQTSPRPPAPTLSSDSGPPCHQAEAPTSADTNTAQFVFTLAILLPAVLRHAFRRACLTVRTSIVVSSPPPASPPPACYAYHPAERQHRRLSWSQRHQWNELVDDAHVSVTFRAPPELQPVLATGPPDIKQRNKIPP